MSSDWSQGYVPAGRPLPATCAQKEKGVKAKAEDTKQFVKGNVAQILGIRGGDQETNIWKIRLQLTKPVTWIPLIWGMPNIYTPNIVTSCTDYASQPCHPSTIALPIKPSTEARHCADNTSGNKSTKADTCSLTAMNFSGVLCGAAASGHFHWTPTDVAKSLTCMLMSGPLLTGYTQTINDYYDKEIDAINEPNRPIPSGMLPGIHVRHQHNTCCCAVAVAVHAAALVAADMYLLICYIRSHT